MFCGFKVYKELERIVHNLKMDIIVAFHSDSKDRVKYRIFSKKIHRFSFRISKIMA